MFNKITLLGNLTKDIELSYPNGSSAFGRGAVATNRKYKGKDGEIKEETLFLNFIINGSLAETAHQYLKKGSKVFLEGRLAQNDYVSSDGVSRIGYQVVVSEMRFLDTKSADNAKQVEKKSQPTASNKATAQATNQKGEPEFDSDGVALPF